MRNLQPILDPAMKTTLAISFAFSTITLKLGILTDYAEAGVWFVLILLFVVSIDFAAAVAVSLKERKFSAAKLLDGAKRKAIGYGLGLAAIHGLSMFLVLKGSFLSQEGGAEVGKWFGFTASFIDGMVYAAIIVREIISICKHLLKFNVRILPKALMGRMEDFAEEGDLETLKKIGSPASKPSN